MAKIKYSALVSDMRNKLNGSVMSKNRYGSYVRNKVTPVNPQSIYQQFSRNLFGASSSAWRGLTPAQVTAWNEAAKDFPFTDIFGDVKHLSGQALFVQLNKNLQQIGQAISVNAPSPLEIPNLVITGASITAGELNISTTGDLPGSEFDIIVYATPPVSSGISYLDNRYRLLISLPGDSQPSSADLMAIYTNRFGQAPSEKVGFRIAVVSTDNGQMGVPSSTQVVFP